MVNIDNDKNAIKRTNYWTKKLQITTGFYFKKNLKEKNICIEKEKK